MAVGKAVTPSPSPLVPRDPPEGGCGIPSDPSTGRVVAFSILHSKYKLAANGSSSGDLPGSAELAKQVTRLSYNRFIHVRDALIVGSELNRHRLQNMFACRLIEFAEDEGRQLSERRCDAADLLKVAPDRGHRGDRLGKPPAIDIAAQSQVNRMAGVSFQEGMLLLFRANLFDRGPQCVNQVGLSEFRWALAGWLA